MIQEELKEFKNKEQAKILSYFFKTGKGQYGEGDVFWGIKVPQSRIVAKKNLNASFKELQGLLDSGIHECRLTALLILVENFKKEESEKIIKFYLKNLKNINNWDLVDLSCPNILGKYLLKRDRKILYELSCSDNLWEKRIAIVSTYYFIKNNDFEDTIKISKTLLKEEHDLIHKAVGWMLREVGKRDEKLLIAFLEKEYYNIPRTALRYAIERLEESKRKYFLNKKYEK
ncbi:MAG: DNA alkylation repair protein [Candidatus Pacebacteria bacterium]|nr:DNA alkylation repair protein [Candidatus Paceibacterota bacterium]MDD3919177.1 DNA alkylation repair protein [Candidatus Paceibacterota bacterium]